MKKEALRAIKDAHDRKASCGTTWIQIECGGDYFRPMVIGLLWDLMTGQQPTERQHQNPSNVTGRASHSLAFEEGDEGDEAEGGEQQRRRLGNLVSEPHRIV